MASNYKKLYEQKKKLKESQSQILVQDAVSKKKLQMLQDDASACIINLETHIANKMKLNEEIDKILIKNCQNKNIITSELQELQEKKKKCFDKKSQITKTLSNQIKNEKENNDEASVKIQKTKIDEIKNQLENYQQQISKRIIQIQKFVRKQESLNKQIKQNNDSINKLRKEKELQIKNYQSLNEEIQILDKKMKEKEKKFAQELSYLPSIGEDEVLSISNQGLEFILHNFDKAQPLRNFLWTTNYKVELPIRIKKSGPGSHKPSTINELWKDSLSKFKNKPALNYEIAPNKWKTLNFQEYYDECIKFAKGIISLGISVFTPVIITSQNIFQWPIAFYGCIFAHYIPVGNYPTNLTQTCEYIVNHSQTELVILQNQLQLKKYYPVIHKCQKVKYFVIMNNQQIANLPAALNGRVILWDKLLKQGASFVGQKQESLEHRASMQKPGNCVTFIYTSGTTGMPKAVMLSHDAYLSSLDGVTQRYQLHKYDQTDMRVLSYLPLSHVAAQLVDVLCPLKHGWSVFYADPSKVSAQLVDYLTIARPTFFLGVPRVWEKIEQKLADALSNLTGIGKKIGDWAMSIGVQGTLAEISGKNFPSKWSIAKKLFFNKLKEKIGMDQVKFFLFGAAPMKESTREFFLKINFFLRNNYGMSETGGAHTITKNEGWIQFNKNLLKEAGNSLYNGEVGIENPDASGIGEVCMRGRNIMMGYFKNETETINTIDKKGFVHSGDEGYLDEQGRLFITGRFKELIVTAGGQNIPPVIIQNQITTNLPIVSQAVLIGDFRKFLTVLLTLKLKNTTQLSDQVTQFIKKKGSKAKTIQEAIKCPIVNKIIEQGIQAANKKAISNAQKVQKFTILPIQITMDSGLLTPTLKLKRKLTHQRFHAEIELMYKDAKL